MPDSGPDVADWEWALTVLAVLVAGAVLLSTAHALTGPDYRGGTVRACQVDAAPANAAVVPASNATVQAAGPVLRAASNATGDDAPFVAFSPDEQASVEAFAERIPAGPAPPNDSDCSGRYYVRYGDATVAVTVAFNA